MSDNNNKIFYSVKFIIIGNQSVGKTNIVHRFAKGEFSNEYSITLGLDYISQNIQIGDKIFLLQLWDTAGSERFRSVTKGYFNNSACAIIVYDVTSESSFRATKEWIEECKKYTNNNIHLVLVGNKIDLVEQRKITMEEGKNFADENGMTFFETSALTGENIEKIFFDSCKIINENLDKNFYDLNNVRNGIKKCEMDDEIMKINKTIFLENKPVKLDRQKTIRIKRKCPC
jgi:small GTP-binding protein